MHASIKRFKCLYLLTPSTVQQSNEHLVNLALNTTGLSLLYEHKWYCSVLPICYRTLGTQGLTEVPKCVQWIFLPYTCQQTAYTSCCFWCFIHIYGTLNMSLWFPFNLYTVCFINLFLTVKANDTLPAIPLHKSFRKTDNKHKSTAMVSPS